MIVGLFTELLSAGGVQRASRHVAAVTSKFSMAKADKPSETHRFLSLNDPVGLHTIQVGSHEFSVRGYARNKWKFALAALRAVNRNARLVIATHPHLAPVVALMKLRSRKIHSIIFAHGIEVWKPLKGFRGAALRMASVVIAPSKDTAQHLIQQQKIQSKRIRQLAWGLDPEFEYRLRAPHRPPRPAAFSATARVILTVGRWDEAERYKGADTLISALPEVLLRVPNAMLIVVGDGGDRPRLEQLARKLGISTRARFLPGLTQEDLFACYAHCEVFALPSRGEGFGLVFLEAMAHAKPVIGGAHGGIPDVIEDGISGLLVTHGDSAELARALISILSDSDLAGTLGRNGRHRVETSYTFEQFELRLIPIIQDVLAGKQSLY